MKRGTRPNLSRNMKRLRVVLSCLPRGRLVDVADQASLCPKVLFLRFGVEHVLGTIACSWLAGGSPMTFLAFEHLILAWSVGGRVFLVLPIYVCMSHINLPHAAWRLRGACAR